jgi:dipeptidyl aminopeptidase/acylaminoacyl peptidase
MHRGERLAPPRIPLPDESGSPLRSFLWDAASGERLARFEAPLTDPRLSPDGRLLALFDPERQEISLHDVDHGVVVATIAGAESLPAGDPFSPDQRWLAYGLENRLHLADVNTGETAVILSAYPAGQSIARVLWSPQSDALVAAGAPINGGPGMVILWEETAVGEFTAAHHVETVRAGYTCCVTIAAFNPGGSRVAFEMLPDFEASSLAIEVYDRRQGLVSWRLPEYELQAWSSDELLLTNEGQFERRLTQWNIISGSKTVSTAWTQGSELYAPNGLFHAAMSTSGPNIGRTLQIGSRLSNQSVAQANVGNDVGVISWSPDGRWLVALANDSSLWLWPVSFPQP